MNAREATVTCSLTESFPISPLTWLITEEDLQTSGSNDWALGRIAELCKRVHCVDLDESFQTHIYLQHGRRLGVSCWMETKKIASSAGGESSLELSRYSGIIARGRKPLAFFRKDIKPPASSYLVKSRKVAFCEVEERKATPRRVKTVKKSKIRVFLYLSLLKF